MVSAGMLFLGPSPRRYCDTTTVLIVHYLQSIQCLRNTSNEQRECDYWEWRDDLQRAQDFLPVQKKATSRTTPPSNPCPGTSCQTKRNPSQGNSKCSFGRRCAECCRRDRGSALGPTRCTVPAHNQVGDLERYKNPQLTSCFE